MSVDPETVANSRRIRVWDVPTRVFHWLLAASFGGAWLLSESERFRNLHVGFGYAVVALIAWRIVWGFVGTGHARFAGFIAGPRAILDYVRGLLRGTPRHYAGHNPLGAVAILAILVLAVATAATGWLAFNDIGGRWSEELHEGLAAAWLAVVVAHVAGVVLGSVAHRENLARAMITGWKRGLASDAIRRSYAALGVLLALVAAGAFVWGAGLFGSRPDAAPQSAVAAVAPAPDNHDED